MAPASSSPISMFQETLPTFAPHVKMFLKSLSGDKKVGLGPGEIVIQNPASGSPFTPPSCVNPQLMDRMKLVIPYGGLSVTWEVFFQANYPQIPPDFIFPDESDFMPELEEVPTMCNWESKNSDRFLKVLKEFINCYRKKQVKHLEAFERLHFEYTTLIQQADISEENIEVAFQKKNRTGQVNFLIQLPINFTGLPIFYANGNTSEDSALLLVTFHCPEGLRITSQLFLSPRIECLLSKFDKSIFRIPNIANDSCLMDYVPLVKENISSKVKQIVSGYQKRKDYVSAFLSHFGRNVLECDLESYNSLSFLFEWKQFFFIVLINLSKGFPQDKPILTLQSVYHLMGIMDKKPFKMVYKDYPYSPRWPGREMAERTRAFVLANVSIFQIASTKNS